MTFLLAVAVPGSPIISEFMALNESSIQDSDGDRSDWIEIRNSSAAAIDLGGYSLTDDASNPTKWMFPNQSLGGGAYLLVFASGKDRRPLDGELHTNFKLDGDGEYLALFAPGGIASETVFDPFPPQVEDLSYGEGATTTTSTAIHAGAACRWRVPSGTITDWNGLSYNGSSWTAATTGIGYERSSLDTYDPLISPGGDVDSQMYRSRSSAYIRIPFELEDAALVSGMILRMKYDDGFAAFINGQAITSDRAPSSLNWNSSATANHDDSDALVFTDFPVAKLPNNLVDGQNILAIQGLNRSIDSSDFLILPELDMVRSTIMEGSLGFHPTPTPGEPNNESFDGIVEDTKFSVKRGFFSLPFPVSITSATGDAQIRYTTDGSEPSATSGSIYTTPVTISTTTVLRAAAFKSGFAPTNVDTQTYIFTSTVRQQVEMDSSITNSSAYSNLMDTALRGNLPTVSLVTQDSNLSKLSNNGEPLTLTDAFGQTISRIKYSDSAPWPTPADGHGRSLEQIDLAGAIDESVPASWRASVIAGGTPGKPAVTNYATWIAAFFDPTSPEFDALADPQADPETDRLANVIEYALARSPVRAETGGDSTRASKVIVTGLTFAAFTYRYQPGLSDLAITVGSSSDLLNWSSANLAMVGSPITQPDGTDVVTTRPTIPFFPETPVFFRLSIQLQHD